MTTGRSRKFKGLSLIEPMIAIVILTVAVLGASGYRYYSTLDSRRADMRSSAARVAVLLSESWRGAKGIETYDPLIHLNSNLAITKSTGPDAPEEFNVMGSYIVTENNFNCYITLSWKDADTGLRALNITIAWAQRDAVDITLDDTDKLLKLTTYTETTLSS